MFPPRFGRLLILLWVGLCLACALRIYGYYHPDEFGQIVSFYLMKLGAIPADELPWEYEARMRPWLQPALYYVLLLPVYAVTGFRHLLFETITQLVQFSFVVGCLPLFLYLIDPARSGGLLRDMPSRMFALFMATLWFVPLMVVRHSSEAFSIVLMVAGLYCWRRGSDPETDHSNSRTVLLLALLAGICAGLSAWVRFQLGLFWAAFFLVALAYDRLAPRVIPRYATAFAGIVLSIGFALLVDRWGYGEWTFPPWNYFDHNIIQDVSSGFGTEPWHWYFKQATDFMVTPLFLLILARAIWVARVDAFLGAVSAGLAAFVILHSLVPHKEIRFLLPMIAPVALLLFHLHTRPRDSEPSRWWKRAQVAHWALAIAVNLIAFGVTFYIRGVREKYQVSHSLWNAPHGTRVFTYSNMFWVFDQNHEEPEKLRWEGAMEPWIRPPFIRLEYMRVEGHAAACRRHPDSLVLHSMAEKIPAELKERLAAPPKSDLMVDLNMPAYSRFPDLWWKRRFRELYDTHWRYKLVRCRDYLEFLENPGSETDSK